MHTLSKVGERRLEVGVLNSVDDRNKGACRGEKEESGEPKDGKPRWSPGQALERFGRRTRINTLGIFHDIIVAV